MTVKVLVEFIGPIKELIGRDYIVLELNGESNLREALRALSRLLGEEKSRQLEEMLNSGRAFILVNGLRVFNLDMKLDHMDKIYILPIAFGG
jgi:molybdopterin converting factor small subunit